MTDGHSILTQPSRARRIAAYAVLMLGLLLVAGLIGFMVGASATSVVGVALTGVIALLPIALDALKRRADHVERERLRQLLEKTPAEAAERAGLEQALSNLQTQAPFSPALLGAGLICVSLGCFVGVVAGGLARVRGWYQPSASVQSPPPWQTDAWKAANCDLSAKSLLSFINVRTDLLSLGYSWEQVNEMFFLTKDYWCKRRPTGEPPEFPWAGEVTEDGKCVVNSNGALNFVALRDYLARLGYNEKVANTIYRLSPGEWCPATSATAVLTLPQDASFPASDVEEKKDPTRQGPGIVFPTPRNTDSPIANGGPDDVGFMWQAEALREAAKEESGSM